MWIWQKSMLHFVLFSVWRHTEPQTALGTERQQTNRNMEKFDYSYERTYKERGCPYIGVFSLQTNFAVLFRNSLQLWFWEFGPFVGNLILCQELSIFFSTNARCIIHNVHNLTFLSMTCTLYINVRLEYQHENFKLIDLPNPENNNNKILNHDKIMWLSLFWILGNHTYFTEKPALLYSLCYIIVWYIFLCIYTCNIKWGGKLCCTVTSFHWFNFSAHDEFWFYW